MEQAVMLVRLALAIAGIARDRMTTPARQNRARRDRVIGHPSHAETNSKPKVSRSNRPTIYQKKGDTVTNALPLTGATLPSSFSRHLMDQSLTLRPMSASQVLDRTFELYRSHFVLFAGIALVGPTLSLIASLIQLRLFGLPVVPEPGKFDPALFQSIIMRALIGAAIGIVIYILGHALASGATIHAVSMVHLGKSTTISECYKRIKPIFGRILGVIAGLLTIAWGPVAVAYLIMVVAVFLMAAAMRSSGPAMGGANAGILVALLSFLGFLGGIVWGFYAVCRYALAVPAAAVEDLRPARALSRSKFLSKGSVGRIFGVYLLTGIIGLAVTLLLQAPAYAITSPFAMKPGAISTAYYFWAFLGSFLGQTLAGPIATIAIALLYYDERVRKEAFDLQLLMESAGPAGASPPETAPASLRDG